MPAQPISENEKALIDARDVLHSHCTKLASELDNIATLFENFLLESKTHEAVEIRQVAQQAVKNASS